MKPIDRVPSVTRLIAFVLIGVFFLDPTAALAAANATVIGGTILSTLMLVAGILLAAWAYQQAHAAGPISRMC